ncbi:polyprenyl synthetase family protein [Micrococcus sp. M4NT]|uniref:polyprenyl synthetase family protein n=1 Tax=Micrococcus sp. M4NT TaxID=2957501 RepID=UPI0029A3E615|nr:polyprenyl synthetase family protein [Micrococcus sp. M4NT]MDX2341678.1 polyprenyl synthetase family protein [Micrococcus sp. M4NT]
MPDPDACSRMSGILDEALTHAASRAPDSAAFAGLVETLRAPVAGGKLVRPQLVDLGYRAAAGGPVPPADRAAVDRLGAAFELLHTALIVHDDVIDRDTVRRGRPTVAEEHRVRLAAAGVPAGEDAHAGLSMAVIAGDALLAEALHLAVTCTPDPVRAVPVAVVVMDAATATAAGELEDVLLGLSRHTGDEPDLARILAMQRLKTARYSFEAPLRAGALLAGSSEEFAAALADVGADLGVAYQVVDDVLGVFGSPAATGKSAAGDLREGKATVVTAHGRRDPAVRALLDRAAASPGAVDAARRGLEGAGAREHARSVAAELVERGRARLAALPLGTAERSELEAACRAVLEREA